MHSQIWQQWMAGSTTKDASQPENRVTVIRPSGAALSKKEQTTQRLAMLGIPKTEMTEAVHLAVSALMEKLDDMNRELHNTREALNEIERMVDVDVLAPIPNRRAFMRRLSWAINMNERYGHPSTILFFDLNGFKQINDEFGHAAGDIAIRHVSHLLAAAMRESDFLARIGGDEFAVIMYYADEAAAKKRGARMVEKLERSPFLFNDRRIVISAAFGCHAIRSGEDAETALANADTSMYIDKKRSKTKNEQA
jgi:diguanylate cyclase (GGDEF)-like protein